MSTESVWEFDQRLKTLMYQVIFQISDIQQKEQFIATLLPQMNNLTRNDMVSNLIDNKSLVGGIPVSKKDSKYTDQLIL